MAAAQAKFEAAAPGAALELLATADMCPLDALQRARVERLRAQLTFAHGGTSALRPCPPCSVPRRRLESLDAQLARATYLDALRAGIFAGKLLDAGEMYEAAESARTAPPVRTALGRSTSCSTASPYGSPTVTRQLYSR